MMRMRMRMRMNGMTDGSDVYIEYGDDDNAGGRGLSRDRGGDQKQSSQS